MFRTGLVVSTMSFSGNVGYTFWFLMHMKDITLCGWTDAVALGSILAGTLSIFVCPWRLNGFITFFFQFFIFNESNTIEIKWRIEGGDQSSRRICYNWLSAERSWSKSQVETENSFRSVPCTTHWRLQGQQGWAEICYPLGQFQWLWNLRLRGASCYD